MSYDDHQNAQKVAPGCGAISGDMLYENDYNDRNQCGYAHSQSKRSGRHLDNRSHHRRRKRNQTRYWIIAMSATIFLSAIAIHGVACAPLKENIVHTWFECSGYVDYPEFLFVGNHIMEYRIDTARALESTTLICRYYWFPISSDKIAVRMAYPGCKFHVYEVDFILDGLEMTISPSITGSGTKNKWLLWK